MAPVNGLGFSLDSQIFIFLDMIVQFNMADFLVMLVGHSDLYFMV